MPTATTHTMKLAEEHGAVLTGRQSAAKIAEQIIEQIAMGRCVEVDFDDVRAVSPSFADELFGKLTTRVDMRHVRFTNLSAHLESVARMARQHRRDSDLNG